MVDIISRHSSQDPGMLAILCALMQLSLCHDFIVQSQHIPGKHNIVADTLSRSLPDPRFSCQHILHMAPRIPPRELISLIPLYGICSKLP